MDILAHGLWVGAGLAWARRHVVLSRPTVVATVGLAVAPDLAHLLPALVWAVGGAGSWQAILDYAVAVPGHEPATTALVQSLTHHLHCVFHSAVVAGAVTLLLRWWWRVWWLPLLGWWSHIAIDVPTHSNSFYPVPVLYPFTQAGFDGLAWNTPWFLVLNYLALAGAWGWIAWRHRANGAAR